jgi:glycosyltransferase involved in cell wall biosynthesis
MRVGIDASNVGGGGGITHLKEIILHYDNEKYNGEICSITVYASQKVLDSLPSRAFLIKKTFPEFNQGLLKRILFQLFKYDKIIKKDCDILFAITGDYLGSFEPMIGMSRNMLLYERDIWKEIKQPKEIVRFWVNFLKQKRCFSNAKGIIFISNYAKKYINDILNLKHKEIKTIHHGVSSRFLKDLKVHKHISEYSFENPFKLLYVSPIHVYKHQWNVIEAVTQLRNSGYPIELELIGNVIFEPAGKKLQDAVAKNDPDETFIKYKGYVNYIEIDKEYSQANGLIFASTCENMPNTLIEYMSSGTVIACSEKEPMPEFLKENGYYFNPKKVDSIVCSLEKMLKNPINNNIFAQKNLIEAKKYNWFDTSLKTFDFLLEVYNKHLACVE